jgi:ABC-type Fe3+ transport system substrate-binding protein
MAYDISPLEFLVKGAPVDHMLSEGIADIIALAVLKGAPHPNTAWLFTRWALSEEGQKPTLWAVERRPIPRWNPARISGRRPFTRLG